MQTPKIIVMVSSSCRCVWLSVLTWDYGFVLDKESKMDDLEIDLKLQAERRKSLLDHHWAVPSKDRYGLREEISSAVIVSLLFSSRVPPCVRLLC